ncbi:MAG TPA: hypothetical protein VK469_10190, partial [Candidatus Kapabacteria bacterium]|nr:hypothetical protein [Candidatus Kapabacteria bacterium]
MKRKFFLAVLVFGFFFLISPYLYSQDTPPWYETRWAYMLYGAVIAGFLFVFFFVKWRAGKVIHEKQRLEQIVIERTKEINNKNRQLEDQIL